MPVKIFSVLAIIAACCFIGNEMASSLKRRADMLEGFICAISMTESFISALSMPLCDIYRNLAEHIKILSPFFIELASSPLPTGQAWKTQLKNISSISDDDRKILLSMAKTLGTCDTETQLNNLALTKKRLTDNLSEARAKIKSDAGMYKSVSIFTGIGIAVLLI